MPFRLLCAALALTFAACDAAAPATDAGTHTLQTQGAFDETLGGRALFGPALYDGQASFTLQLQTARTAPNVLVALDWPGTAPPAAGTYRAVPTFAEAAAGSGRVVVSYVRSSTSPSSYDAFQPTGGTVTISESSAQRLRGTLAVDLGSAGRTLRLTGAFTATAGH